MWKNMVECDLKPDGTRWRPGGEVKGKLVNGVGSQYSSHYLGTWCIQHYYRWCSHLGCQQSTKLTTPADLNGLDRLAERRNLVSARVPSRFKRGLQQDTPQMAVERMRIVCWITKAIHHTPTTHHTHPHHTHKPHRRTHTHNTPHTHPNTHTQYWQVLPHPACYRRKGTNLQGNS